MLPYGCESWSFTKTMEMTLNAAENKWLRRILKISYREHFMNEEFRSKTQQPQINGIIKRRMKWAGHILRMSNNRNPKRIVIYKPKGKRAIERPKQRWIDCLDQDLKASGLPIHKKTEGRQRLTLEEIIARDREQLEGCCKEISTGNSQKMIIQHITFIVKISVLICLYFQFLFVFSLLLQIYDNSLEQELRKQKEFERQREHQRLLEVEKEEQRRKALEHREVKLCRR